MPIMDYEDRAKKQEIRFFGHSKISEANKEAMRKVLKVYHVRPPTKFIFLQRLEEFLQHFKDISKEMFDFDKVNDVLSKLQHKGTFETYRNKSKRFAKLLNDGVLPKEYARAWSGFKKKKGGRNIEPEQHLTWIEAKELIKHTTSTQLKCMVMFQLDAGLRPSEFVDLNYGDVKIVNDFVVIKVMDGKTGKRDVQCWRCVPYVARWIESHPTKKSSDP